MPLAIDHIVLAAPDLERAKDQFANWAGVAPVDGGPHPGGGTCNALVSFGAGAYLEIIAPDPQQRSHGNFSNTNGARIAALAEPELLHWAVRTDHLEEVSRLASESGFVPGAIRDMARETPEGARLEWRLMGVGGHSLGGLVPFFIDWCGSPHPADSAPVVGPLTRVAVVVPKIVVPKIVVPKVVAPKAATEASPPIAPLLADIAGVSLEAEAEGLLVEFDSARGPLGWQAIAPRGFGF